MTTIFRIDYEGGGENRVRFEPDAQRAVAQRNALEEEGCAILAGPQPVEVPEAPHALCAWLNEGGGRP